MTPKILTIDDSKTIRLIVAKAFKSYDCAVFEAENGLTGLAVAAQEKPDLIILDYTMPVMDGFETLSKLRVDPNLKSTPVIMLTAEAGRDTVLKMAKLSIRDYLIKPFKEDALIERANKVLQLHKKNEVPLAARRYDDAIQILVVDDKPAIIEQVRSAVADTNWVVTGITDTASALEHCNANGVDAIFASLSLPQDAAFALAKNLKANPRTRTTPLVGLAVKTATAEQARAQQEGFSGCVNKPIDPSELKSKICRALRLETSYRYFQQRGAALCLKLPKDTNSNVAHEVTQSLKQQLAASVDAGNDKFVIDLTDVTNASLPVIQLAIGALEASRELSLRSAVIGSDAFRSECRNFQETQSLNLVGSFEEALTALN